MKMIRLNKQHNKPDFGELTRMICDLGDFLNEDTNPNDKRWNENLKAIIDFQDDEGSFKLFDTYEIPADARVDFCHMPTYLCTAILMKAFMSCPEEFGLDEKHALSGGLKMSCARNLRGHGYEALKGQIDALNIFMKAGLNEFIDLHPDFCPEFTAMINEIIRKFEEMQTQGNFKGPWGESYEQEIRAVNEYFSNRIVFVYGTLMEGETNHHFLEASEFLGPAAVEGYDMYDVGWYPAIVSGTGIAVGELYRVPADDMPSIDMLEGEGSLYIKRCETVTDSKGNTIFALAYIYIKGVSDLERIPAWNRKYVWYVSYGSNMLRERFLCYINGGAYKGGAYREACSDTTPPLAVKTVEIPFDMYFGHISQSWGGCGVSFIDTTKKGKALGVAYLITEEQLKHVAAQENGGHAPEISNGWYTHYRSLGKMDGFEVVTITNEDLRTPNSPSPKYLETLAEGIKENWPDMPDEEIEDYLTGCIR